MKTKKEIFKDLVASAETKCVLKIAVKGSPNPVITAVERINKQEIVLKPTCLYGYKLKKRTVRLHEIEAVTRYKTFFHHPIFEKLRFIKNNFSLVRNNFEAFEHASSGMPGTRVS